MALALNHHQVDHLIGPGRPLDTDKYFIICSDALGNTQTTFEHSTSPTNSGLKMAFPPYNLRDRVKAEHKLVTEGLGIPRLLAVTGISSGAAHSVQFAISYPDFMDGIFPIAGGALGSSQGFFYVPLIASTIASCAGWNGGNYDDNPRECAANALSVLVSYFYTRDWWAQYIDAPEAYTKWRNHWGDYYLDIQDARDLYYLAVSFGRGWVGDTPGFNGNLSAALRSIKARTLFLYNPQDQLHTPQHIEAPGQGDSQCAGGTDQFGRRSPDLLQRRSAGHPGPGRGDTRVPARAEREAQGCTVITRAGGTAMERSPRPDVARRAFLAGTCALGTTSLLGLHHGSAGAQPAPETRKIRFVHAPSICSAPQYLAEELLRLDGFTDVEYLPLGARNGPRALADGRADITMWDVPGLIPHLDAGRPIVLLAGVHRGVMSCSSTSVCARCGTSRGRPWPFNSSGAGIMSWCRACWRTSG